MIKKILLAIVVLVALVCVYAAFQPEEFKVARSAEFRAPPSAVFAVINDFKRWQEWSPWAKLDPQMKATYEGPSQGVGAVYHWSGNSEVGEGTNRLVESKPDEMVKMKLTFVRPFAGEADVLISIEPTAAGAKATWAMSSKNNFIGKLMGVFMDCEKMCGDQFLEGFENLRKVVEAPTTDTPTTETPAAKS